MERMAAAKVALSSNLCNMHTIDATGKRVGHIAAAIANRLMGKTTPAFVRNRTPDEEVRIVNASKLDIPERKRSGKTYTRYSGHPGGLRKEKLSALLVRRGHAEALRRAVYGMLPHNKLRARAMRRLRIET